MAFTGEDVFVKPKDKHVRSVADIVRAKIGEANPPMYFDEPIKIVRLINPKTGDCFVLKDNQEFGATEDGDGFLLEVWHPEFESEDTETGECPVDIYTLYGYSGSVEISHRVHFQDSRGEIVLPSVSDPYEYYDLDINERYAHYKSFISKRSKDFIMMRNFESHMGLDRIERQRVLKLGALLRTAVVVSV